MCSECCFEAQSQSGTHPCRRARFAVCGVCGCANRPFHHWKRVLEAMGDDVLRVNDSGLVVPLHDTIWTWLRSEDAGALRVDPREGHYYIADWCMRMIKHWHRSKAPRRGSRARRSGVSSTNALSVSALEESWPEMPYVLLNARHHMRSSPEWQEHNPRALAELKLNGRFERFENVQAFLHKVKRHGIEQFYHGQLERSAAHERLRRAGKRPATRRA